MAMVVIGLAVADGGYWFAGFVHDCSFFKERERDRERERWKKRERIKKIIKK